MTPKAAQTQRRILDASYLLFSEKGYEKTTMRGIAKKAKIASSGIYHYFPSKAHIVQEYYTESIINDEKISREKLNDYTKLGDRLKVVLTQKIAGNLDMHELAKSLLVVAADPKSSLSPFSEESKETRDRSIQIFREIVEGSDLKLTDDLKYLLPEYFWLLQLGILFFWTYDNSSGSKRTLDLIDKLCPILETFLVAIRNPLLRPLRKKIVQILTNFKLNIGDAHA